MKTIASDDTSENGDGTWGWGCCLWYSPSIIAHRVSRALHFVSEDISDVHRRGLGLRMVFNAITGTVDDHVKNISYTMDRDGIWHLAPAYDVTLSVSPEDGLGEMHKLSINGKHDNLSREGFRQVANNMEIKKADRIIDEVWNMVVHWPEFAREAGVSLEVIDHVGRYHLTQADWPQPM